MSLIREYITELIKEGFSNPIHSFDKYFYIQNRKIDQLLALNKSLQTELDKISSDEDDEWEFSHLLKNLSNRELSVHQLKNVNVDTLIRPKELMDNILKYRDLKFLNYLFKYLEIQNEEYSDIANSRRMATASLDMSNEDAYYGIDKEKAKLFTQVITGLLNVHKGILNLHLSLEKRLKEDDRWRKYKDSREVPEEAQEIETLYHVSINANIIAKTGFVKGYRKDSSMGLGGAGHNEGLVSFTHNLRAARNIARTFKDIIYIAHGQLRAPQIMEWYRAEGMEEQLKKFLRENKNFDQNNPHHVFLMFNTYLWHSKMRENPLFMNTDESLINNFKMKQTQDVGIIVAKVNVRHPDVQYVKVESEVRAPVDAILSIEKVI